MARISLVTLVLWFSMAVAGEPIAIDSRLAKAIEQAVVATGIDININESTQDSININTVNGRNVCDPEAAEDVNRLQTAINAQPYIRNNFGPAFYSVGEADGSRKTLTPEQLAAQGITTKCKGIYVSVTAADTPPNTSLERTRDR
jgi:predicted RND superfamily exporter protein